MANRCLPAGMGRVLAATAVLLPVCMAASSETTTAPGGASSRVSGATQPAAKASSEPPDWFKPLKDIPVGPGLLSVDVNVRSRYEWLSNFNIQAYNTDGRDDLLILRTQVGVDYRLTCPPGGTAPHFYVQGQDSRYWLSELQRDDFPTNCPYFDQADLRQAYVEWHRVGGTPLGFKIGRQNIAYRGKRVFGPGDWGNVGGYWWDAVKIYVETKAVQVDVMYGRRILSEQTAFNDQHHDFDMLAVYAQIKRLPFVLDVFYVLRYDDGGQVRAETGTGDEHRHTVGLHVDGKVGRWDYRGTGAWQTGRVGPDDICAFGLNARLGYTFDAPWKPRLGAEFSYASGDRNPRDGKCGTFDGLFAGVGGVYGWMNVVSWKNLADYEATFSIQPTKALSLSTEYHMFRLASDTDGWYWCNGKSLRRDATGHSGSGLGQEIDLIARWQMCRNLELLAGYSHFFAGSFVRGTQGGGDADWVFAQLTFKF